MKVLLAVSLMFMNQQCSLKEASLNRNVQKTRIWSDHLTKGSQESSPVSPWEQWFSIHEFSIHSNFTELPQIMRINLCVCVCVCVCTHVGCVYMKGLLITF